MVYVGELPPLPGVNLLLANSQVKIGINNSRVVGLDGDMKNSTFSEKLRNLKPEQHIECFICEQNMAGVS